MAITGVSLRAAWSSRVRSGTMGIRSPMASPSPNDTPTRRPVNDPGPVATATLVSLWGAISARIRSMSSGLLAGSNSSCRTAPETSRIASALVADDVSTTKITVDPDEATVAAEVLDGDHRGVRADCPIHPIYPVAPLDDHGSRIQQLIEAEVAQLVSFFQPVQV